MADGIHELTAGYALDALDDDERRAYEDHLAGCEYCRDELASFWDVTSALAVAASGPEPSAQLRDRVLASVQAEPQTVVPLASPRRRSATPVIAAIAAVAAVVAIGLGVYAVSLSNDLEETRAALAQAPRVVPIEGADGRLVVQAQGRGWLALSGLPDAPAGKTYEIWVIEGQTPRRAGLFDGAPSATLVKVERRVPAGAVIAVTEEQDGGVNAPTTAPVLTSKPV
jgi:anti-sigma-K factor RskA